MIVKSSVPLRVLIVDDNEADRVLYKRLLGRNTQYEFAFSDAEAGDGALEQMNEQLPDCVLLDYHLPDCYGLELVAFPAFAKYKVPVVMLTGLGSVAIARDAMNAGVHACLNKRNVTSDTLLSSIVDAISSSKLA